MDQEIHLCSNEVPIVTNGHALRKQNCIYVSIGNMFKTFPSHESLVRVTLNRLQLVDG